MPDNAPPDESNEPDHIKQLRQQAASASDLQKQLDQQKRELAFAKAGVDTESKLGSMLFKTYDGDLTTDALLGEAKEIGLIKEQSDQAPPPPSGEQQQTQQRQDLASGSLGDQVVPDGPPPMDQAWKDYHERTAKGESKDTASQAVFSGLIQRAVAGDEKYLVKENR